MSNRMADAIIGTVAIAAAFAAFLVLVFAVWGSTKSPDCERLYNQYTNTTNVQMQQALMNKGVENGCFHSE